MPHLLDVLLISPRRLYCPTHRHSVTGAELGVFPVPAEAGFACFVDVSPRFYSCRYTAPAHRKKHTVPDSVLPRRPAGPEYRYEREGAWYGLEIVQSVSMIELLWVLGRGGGGKAFESCSIGVRCHATAMPLNQCPGSHWCCDSGSIPSSKWRAALHRQTQWQVRRGRAGTGGKAGCAKEPIVVGKVTLPRGTRWAYRGNSSHWQGGFPSSAVQDSTLGPLRMLTQWPSGLRFLTGGLCLHDASLGQWFSLSTMLALFLDVGTKGAGQPCCFCIPPSAQQT